MTSPLPVRATPSAVAAVERALRRTSRLLVSTSDVDLAQVLEAVGEALGVDSVVFTGASDPTPLSQGDAVSPAPTYLMGQSVAWARPVPRLPAAEPEAGSLAVPLLGSGERYVGHLELGPSEHGDLSAAPCDRFLGVLGDLLVTHLARLAHDEARLQTEERWNRLVDRHPDPTMVVVEGTLKYANAAAASLLGTPSPSDLVDRPFDDFVSAEDIGRVNDAREAQIAHPASGPFGHDVIRVDGTTRHVESISVPFPGTDAAVQTVLRDLTDRKASEDRYRMFVQVTSDGVWSVRLDPPVPRTATVRELADTVLDRGRFAELNPAMVRMLSWGQPLSLDAPVGEVLGETGHQPVRALVRALVRSDYNVHAYEVAAPGPRGDTRHYSINAVGRFEGDAVCEVWGNCADITERVEMERRLVTVLEDQQERIGRDLHDSVGQLLTGVRMLSDGLASRAGDGPEAEVAEKIAGYTAEALDRVREICRGLVPPQLYSEGAAGAIAELVEHVDALGRTRCVFHHDGTADLADASAALQAYRVVQEAISNALRHAGPETIWVTLSGDGLDVVIEVEDDGAGFDPEAARSRSLGLYGMGRRAGSVGGTFAVESAPGSGTTVRATFPSRRPGDVTD